MGLFSKNPNETAYVGGKKHWTDVIKNSGSGEMLIWRQPEEDFNTNSTLIVMPGEEAIFINGGVIEEVFTRSGTYKLTTQNYPFISRLRNSLSGGISTFNCVVYFVRVADSKEILWGTDSPIQVRDKVWKVRTDARVRGAYKVKIENATQFLTKYLGNNVSYSSQEDLDDYFKVTFEGKIKTVVSQFLNSLDQELIGIDAYLDELSKRIEPSIDEILFEYGLRCINFSLSGLDIDITKYDAFDKAQIDYVTKQREYQSKKAGVEILGDDWERITYAELLSKAVENPGSGSVASTSAGLGLGFAMGGVFNDIGQRTFGSFSNPVNSTQPVSRVSEAFPSEQEIQQPQKTKMDRMKELTELMNAGFISQQEYEQKRKEIIDEI